MMVGDRVRITRYPVGYLGARHVGREGLVTARHRCVPAGESGGWQVDVDLFETCGDCARRVTVPEECLAAAPVVAS